MWKTKNFDEAASGGKVGSGSIGFLVGGVPWRVKDDDPKADGEAMKMDIPSEARHATEQEKEEMAQDPIPRNFYITKEHLTKCGFSQDCLGCKPLLRGTTRQDHNNTACRRDLRRKLPMIRRSGEPSKSRPNSRQDAGRRREKKETTVGR